MYDSVNVSSFNPSVDEGLDLDDSSQSLPQEAIAQIQPGWNLQVKELGGKEYWVQVLSREPQGFVCQVLQQPEVTTPGKQIFVRLQNIEAAAGGSDNLVQDGKGLSATRTVIRQIPGGQAQSYQSYSVYSSED